MAKIIIDPKIQGVEGAEVKKELLQKVFQVALTTVSRLGKIDHLVKVEIVKITWKIEKWEEGKDPLVTDFQVVFRPSFGEKVRAVLRFKANRTILMYGDDPEKEGSYITTWPSDLIEELDVEDIVGLLLKAMVMMIERHKSFHKKAVAKIERVVNAIENKLPA